MLILPAPETAIVTPAHCYPSHLAVSVYPTAMILAKPRKALKALRLIVEAEKVSQCSRSRLLRYGSGCLDLNSKALYLVAERRTYRTMIVSVEKVLKSYRTYSQVEVKRFKFINNEFS